MCLAMPAQVIALKTSQIAVVQLGGVEKNISLALVDDVCVGDYVVIHVGYALTKLDELEAQKTLALFSDMAELGDADNAWSCK